MRGDKSVVIFNGYTGGPACLSFYYHMYGRNVNQLRVNLGGANVFQRSGSQGNEWKKAEVSINGRGNVRIYYTFLKITLFNRNYFVQTFLNLKTIATCKPKFRIEETGDHIQDLSKTSQLLLKEIYIS